MPTEITFPSHFCEIGPAVHPVTGISGILLRSRSTGVYSFFTAGRYSSVPHRWAGEHAAALGKPADAIQDICIKRMEELSMTPETISQLLPDISAAHILAYLTRRSSMGSHKISRLLPVLDLELVPRAVGD